MSFKSAMLILAAILAVAMTGMTAFTADSEAAVFDEEFFGNEQRFGSEPQISAPIQEPVQSEPANQEQMTTEPMSLNDGPVTDRHEVVMDAPAIMDDRSIQEPMESTSPEFGPDRPMGGSGYEQEARQEPPMVDQLGPETFGTPFAYNGPQFGEGPAVHEYFSTPEPENGAPDRIIDLPKRDRESSTEEVIKDYEKAYYEKKDLESKGKVVVVNDTNQYSEEQTEIVEAMKEIIDDSSSELGETDFLMKLIERLKLKSNYGAADLVRNILDERFFGPKVHAELQPNGSRSKGDSDDEDDMNADPFQIVDVSEEESDVPAFLGVTEGKESSEEDSFQSADMNFCVRYDDRGCCVAI